MRAGLGIGYEACVAISGPASYEAHIAMLGSES